MRAVLFVGSPRARSNTRSIGAHLRGELVRTGVEVDVLDPPRDEAADPEFLTHSIATLQKADVLVVLAPVYLDLPPYKTLSWLHGLWQRRDEVAERDLAVYAVSHSGYFEPAHKAVSMKAFELLAEGMDWTWCGGLGFGGTSPIDGRSLEEAGPFARRLRPALAGLADSIAARRPVSPRLEAQAAKSPLPLPRWMVVRLMNAMLRRQRRRRSM